MKRAVVLALLVCVALLGATALMEHAPAEQSAQLLGGALALSTPITGEQSRQGEDGTELRLRYAYPQFEAWTDADKAINAYYQALASDLGDLAEPMEADVAFEVTHNTSRYLSVALTIPTLGGSGESQSLSADTFARDGIYAGEIITLSQVLGLEQEGGELNDSESVAEELAYKLVWQIVERDSQNADGDYLDGITAQEVRSAFRPETDFYLDEDGNVVFFIQAGEIAGEIAGILRFPFSPAEMLSALKP